MSIAPVRERVLDPQRYHASFIHSVRSELRKLINLRSFWIQMRGDGHHLRPHHVAGEDPPRTTLTRKGASRFPSTRRPSPPGFPSSLSSRSSSERGR